nr:MAG: nonstructural protein [Microvirus sp.]QJB19622.1 MAG: nonstructural protein [Microvirus sp.]
MIKFVCSVFDRAASVYSAPFLVPHRNVAIRDFTDEVNRADQANPLNRHPDDYDLYLLCLFDDVQGNFDDVEGGPVVLVRGKDVFTVS